MEVYCLQCQKKYKLDQISQLGHALDKKSKIRLTGKCPNGHNVSRYVSRAVGKGLIGNLAGLPGGKVPFLGDIPLLGMLF